VPTRPCPKRRRTINAIVRDRYRSADVLRLSQAALPDIVKLFKLYAQKTKRP